MLEAKGVLRGRPGGSFGSLFERQGGDGSRNNENAEIATRLMRKQRFSILQGMFLACQSMCRACFEHTKAYTEHAAGKNEPRVSMLEARGVLRGCKVVPAPASTGQSRAEGAWCLLSKCLSI